MHLAKVTDYLYYDKSHFMVIARSLKDKNCHYSVFFLSLLLVSLSILPLPTQHQAHCTNIQFHFKKRQ